MGVRGRKPAHRPDPRRPRGGGGGADLEVGHRLTGGEHPPQQAVHLVADVAEQLRHGAADVLAGRPPVQPGQDVVDPQVASLGVVEGETGRRLGEQRLEQGDGRLHRGGRPRRVVRTSPGGLLPGGAPVLAPVLVPVLVVVPGHPGAPGFLRTRMADTVRPASPVSVAPAGPVTCRSARRLSGKLPEERRRHGRRLWPVWQCCAQSLTSDVFGHRFLTSPGNWTAARSGCRIAVTSHHGPARRWSVDGPGHTLGLENTSCARSCRAWQAVRCPSTDRGGTHRMCDGACPTASRPFSLDRRRPWIARPGSARPCPDSSRPDPSISGPTDSQGTSTTLSTFFVVPL